MTVMMVVVVTVALVVVVVMLTAKGLITTTKGLHLVHAMSLRHMSSSQLTSQPQPAVTHERFRE